MILFRFHDHFDVCRDRIALIRRLNPGIEIHGLYGGPEGREDALSDLIPVYAPSLSNQFQGGRTSFMWKHNDLGIRAWFALNGRDLEFDMLHVLEWDLLVLEPVERAFAAVGEGRVGLTGVRPLVDVRDWRWMNCEPPVSEWKGLLAFARERFGYNRIPHACQGPGMCFPKSFLEQYADAGADVLQLCHEELRLPLYAQVLGFDPVDTGITREWVTPFFNCRKQAIPRRTVELELAKPNGCRVFHPFFERLGS
jgi:hypothetical protein